MELKKYKELTLEELIDDSQFRSWVRQSSDEKNKAWAAYIKANPSEKEKLENAKKIIDQLNGHYQKERPDRAAPDLNFAKLLTNIVRLDQAEQKRTLTKPIVQRRWAIAASIAVLLSVGLWFLVGEKAVAKDNWVVHTTEYGEWKKLKLPDGSTAHLNAHAELKLKENWEAGQNRQVWLNGEAFFEVAKKPATQAKFTVITEALQVEVLGTMFNVKSKDDNTQVFLEEGNIQLKSATQKMALKPNDYIDYTKGENDFKVAQLSTKKVDSSWKNGTLILKEQMVADILKRLEEIYGCAFEVERNSLLTERKTLAVPMANLETILPILERTLGVKMEKEGQQIYLRQIPR